METNVAKKRKCIKEERDFDIFCSPSKQIHVAMEQEEHTKILKDNRIFRKKLDELIKQYPERFPKEINEGYHFHSFTRESKKLPGVKFRRIKLKANNEVYTILPYFVMPYMKGYVEDLEKPLFLRKFGVPYWALTYVFGKNDSFWYRLETGLGRNSIVGTTISDQSKMPEHLIADEKFSWENSDLIYVATTSAGDCILGSHVTQQANHLGLIKAYGQFKKEAINVDPNYAPKTVTTDGWKPLRWSWKMLFPSIQLILCFLHSFIKVRDCYYKLKDHACSFFSLIWQAYREKDEASFRLQITALQTWTNLFVKNKKASKALSKLCNKVDFFALAFNVPGCYRTTAYLDRIMDRQDRFLYSCKYFHGHRKSSQLLIRAFALIHNFAPYSPRAKLPFVSPAHRINGFCYHKNWLKNLHLASSMGSYFHRPHKTTE